jgi:phenylacetate-CoA ligase
MVTVRGTNVYQTAVENLIGEMPDVSNSYELVLTREAENDAMTVKFEPVKAVPRERWDALARDMSDRIHKGLHVRLKCEPVAPDSLPKYELKTKRIIDQRPKEFRRALDR